MIEGWGLDKIARDLWKDRGLPPGWLFDRTPAELVFLFGQWDGEGDYDPVAELHRTNHLTRAAKLMPPAVPPWLMPRVPRAKE